MGITTSQVPVPADHYTSRTAHAQTDFRRDVPGSQAQTKTGQTQVFPVRTQVVRQTIGITSVVPVQGRRSQSNARSSGDEFGYFFRITLIRVLTILSSIGVLIAAAIAVSAINEIDDLAMERGDEFENTNSYRGAAGWLVFLGCAALIFHTAMISIQILYFKCSKKEHFKKYQFINAIFSILFALAFLAGGVPNAIFAGDNSELWSRICSFSIVDEFCDSLGRVRGTQIASTVLSFISMLFSIILLIFTLCTDCTKDLEATYQDFLQSATPHPSTSGTRYVPPPVSQSSAPQSAQASVQPSAPQSAQASVLVQPSAPPSYTSANPPSYDSVVKTKP